MPERQVRPEREQQQLLGLHRDGDPGLPRLPGDDRHRICPIYIGCPANTAVPVPDLLLHSDVACASGHCIPSVAQRQLRRAAPGRAPTTATDACRRRARWRAWEPGGTMCTTTLTPAPVLNSAKTACLCVADSDCSSGKCVNKDSQCTGTCTGSGHGRQRGLPDRGLRGQRVVVLDRQLRQRLVADRSVHGGGRPLLVHERLAVPERHAVRGRGPGARRARARGAAAEQRVPLRPVSPFGPPDGERPLHRRRETGPGHLVGELVSTSRCRLVTDRRPPFP